MPEWERKNRKFFQIETTLSSLHNFDYDFFTLLLRKRKIIPIGKCFF